MKRTKQLVLVSLLVIALIFAVVALTACPNTHEVTFRNGGQTLTNLTQTVRNGEFATEPAAADRPAAPTGYEWRHWSAVANGDTAFDFANTAITRDTILHAVFRSTAIVGNYAFSFASAPGVASVAFNPATAVATGTNVTVTVTLLSNWNHENIAFAIGGTAITPTVTWNALVGTFTTPMIAGGGALTITGLVNQNVDNFSVDFYLDGGTGTAPATTTIDGTIAAAAMPADPTKTGYTFQGWWVSHADHIDYLTFRFEPGTTIIREDTTLFALWFATGVNEPLVQVNAAGVNWNSVAGVEMYVLAIEGPAGFTYATTTLSTLTRPVTWTIAGNYYITVTTTGTNITTVTRFFRHNALPRPSNLRVEGNTLVWNAAYGATSYTVSFEDGEGDTITHSNITTTSFNFAGYSIPENGFEFTVTSNATNFASSASRVLEFNRILEVVTGFVFNATATPQILTWNVVPNAEGFLVDIVCSDTNHTHETLELNYDERSIDLRHCAQGEITVTITPIAFGWNTNYTQYTFTKAQLATPRGVTLTGNIISWTAVTGNLTRYDIRIGTEIHQGTTATTFDLETITIAPGTHAISIMAIGPADTNSLWSTDNVSASAVLDPATFSYANNVFSWGAVIGSDSYEIRVNGVDKPNVPAGTHQTTIPASAFTGPSNTIEIRSVSGDAPSAWVSHTVAAFRITFDYGYGSPVSYIYKPQGDAIILPTSTLYGHNNAVWRTYEGNDAPTIGGNAPITLYAHFTAASFTITLNPNGGQAITNNTLSVTFNEAFTITQRPATLTGQGFIGWYTAPTGGERITRELGIGLANWNFGANRTLYARWANLFSYELEAGAYIIRAGIDIDLVQHIFIPSYRQTGDATPIPVRIIGAFSVRPNLLSITLPASITHIEGPAFDGLFNLQSIVVEGATPTSRFRSDSGVLIERDVVGEVVSTFIAHFPAGITGSFTIPDGITHIAANTFAGRNINEVIIPFGVTHIGAGAFRNAFLLTEIYIPGSVVSLGNHAFENASAIETITFGGDAPTTGDGLVMGTHVFLNNRNLSKVIFEPGSRVSNIGANAFQGDSANLSNLRSIDIPATVTAIGNQAFINSGLNTLTFADGSNLATIGNNAFEWSPLTGIIRIPNTVTHIGNNAFGRSTRAAGPFATQGITEIIFEPGGPTTTPLTFGLNVFLQNAHLHTVTFPNHMQTIGTIFANCYALTTFHIDSSNTHLTTKDGVLFTTDYNELVLFPTGKGGTFTIPTVTTRIANNSFNGARNIEYVIFENNQSNLEFIGENAFTLAISLAGFFIPASVETIGDSAFRLTTALKAFTVDPLNNIFFEVDGVLFSETTTGGVDIITLVSYPLNKTATTFEMPDDVTHIATSAFAGQLHLLELTFATTVTHIGHWAFSNSSIEEIIFLPGSQLTHIAQQGLAYMPNLSSLVLPNTVESIGPDAFRALRGLRHFEIEEGGQHDLIINVNNIFHNSFVLAPEDNDIPTGHVSFPSNLTQLGTLANAWQGTFSQGNGALASVSFGNAQNPSRLQHLGHNTFSGTRIQTITIPESVTFIGENVFLGSRVEEVNFEPGIQLDRIRGNTFGQTAYLTTINLPEGITHIDASAFHFAAGLESITIPASVTHIGDNAFAGNRGNWLMALEEVTFAPGSQLISIGNNAFQDTMQLTSIELPSSLTSIGTGVFNGSGVTEINILPSSTRYVSDNHGVLFRRIYNDDATPVLQSYTLVSFPGGNDDITTYTVPAGVTHIGSFAFAGAVYLEEVILPTTLREIGASAFVRMPNLADLILPEGLTTIGANAFQVASISVLHTDAADTPDGVAVAVTTAVSSLTTINIPSTVTTLPITALQNTASFTQTTRGGLTVSAEATGGLAYIDVHPDNQNFRSIDGVLFNRNSAEPNAPSTTLLLFPQGKGGEYRIPDGITAIGTAFNLNRAITKLTIPYSVLSMGDMTFCINLTAIIFEEGSRLTSLASFANNISLTSFEVPAGVTTIPAWGGFPSLPNLTSVTFAEGSLLHTIGSRAFYRSTGIANLVIPFGVTTIQGGAFDHWTADQTIYIEGRTVAPGTWVTNWIQNSPNTEIVWGHVVMP